MASQQDCSPQQITEQTHSANTIKPQVKPKPECLKQQGNNQATKFTIQKQVIEELKLIHRKPLHPEDYNDVAEKEVDVAYARIMLLGTAGVGKTSLKRSLMKLPWDKKTDSTIVCNVDCIELEWQKTDKEWQKVTEEDELREMAELLAIVHQFEDDTSSTSITKVEKLFPISNMLEISDLSDVEGFQKDNVDKVLLESFKMASSIEVTKKREDIKPKPFVHIWDCGGQPVFLDILPAFLTSRTMFLLLYDASIDLHDRWKSVQYSNGERIEEGEVNMTTLNLLLNWLSNIHIHLAKYDKEKTILLNYPRVLCIGTHGDDVKKQKKDPELVKENLKSHCKDKAFEVLIDDHYIVDNTTAGTVDEDPSFNEVRKKVRNFTCDKLIVKTPVSWILFRKIIQHLQDNIITLKQAHAIGLACKIPTKTVPKVLLFYHDLGVLLFYPHIIGLKDIVIISPKWFIDVLSSVLTLKGKEKYKTGKMWDVLREKGILVQPLYSAAWESITAAENCISSESLIDLLVHFRLAAEVKTDQYYDSDVKQYFVPLVLPSYIPEETSLSPIAKPQKQATPLHLIFHTGFVPPGFFTRLITSIAESSLFKINFDNKVYRNHIQMSFGNKLYDKVILMELVHAIQVDIARYGPSNDDVDEFNTICQALFHFLLKTAKEVDHCLFRRQGEKKSCKVFRGVQFVCAGKMCKSESVHYLCDTENHTSSVQVQCQRHRDKFREKQEEEMCWFPANESTAMLKERLSEIEMWNISEKIADNELTKLAAYFNMTADLQRIHKDEHKRKLPGFHLLYEWDKNKIDSTREELVRIMKEIGLTSLAQMVLESKYDKNKPPRPHSAIPTKRPALSMTNSNSFPSGIQSNATCAANLGFIPFTHCSPCNDMEEMAEDEECEERIDGPPITKDGKTFTSSTATSQPQLSINANSDKISPTLNQVDSDESFLKIETTDTGSPVSLIDDNSLLRCCRHIHKRDLKPLAAACSVSTKTFEEMKKEYEGAGANIYAYHLLKKWLSDNPSYTVEQLQERLRALNHPKAASKLKAEK